MFFGMVLLDTPYRTSNFWAFDTENGRPPLASQESTPVKGGKGGPGSAGSAGSQEMSPQSMDARTSVNQHVGSQHGGNFCLI